MAYEDKMWQTIKTTTAEAENCNTGKQPCTMGKYCQDHHRAGQAGRGGDPQEAGRGRRALGWAKRCGAACARVEMTRSARRWGSRRRHL